MSTTTMPDGDRGLPLDGTGEPVGATVTQDDDGHVAVETAAAEASAVVA